MYLLFYCKISVFLAILTLVFIYILMMVVDAAETCQNMKTSKFYETKICPIIQRNYSC